METLYHYRQQGAFGLHAFVVMPDHFHVLITPSGSLERAVQYIKGGFSFRAKKQGCQGEVWQQGFSDHRIRDAADYEHHVEYIEQNPVRARLCVNAADYPFSSARGGFALDPIPQRLKPAAGAASAGGPEGPPFQSNTFEDAK